MMTSKIVGEIGVEKWQVDVAALLLLLLTLFETVVWMLVKREATSGD